MGLNIFFRHWNLGNTCVPMLDKNITFNSPFDSFPLSCQKWENVFIFLQQTPILKKSILKLSVKSPKLRVLTLCLAKTLDELGTKEKNRR
jgi:hypothetical protein